MNTTRPAHRSGTPGESAGEVLGDVHELGTRALRLQLAGTRLLDSTQVATLLGVGWTQVWRWTAASRNYTTGGMRDWPPRGAQYRHVHRPAEDEDLGPVTSWPPDPAVLPPCDDPLQQRWYEQTIVRWAMQVGRMDSRGTPRQPPQRPGRSRGRPSSAHGLQLPTDAELTRLLTVFADERLVPQRELGAALGASPARVIYLLFNTRVLLDGVSAPWPPAPRGHRSAGAAPPGPPVAATVSVGWPAHTRALPSPARVGEPRAPKGYPELTFRAGDLWRWQALLGKPVGTVLAMAAAYCPS